MNEKTINWNKLHRENIDKLDPISLNICLFWAKNYLNSQKISESDDLYANETISSAIKKMKKVNNEWWSEHHFFFGMHFRNQLRDAGFGEDYFEIDNLDDYYIGIIEEALGILP